MYVGGFICLLVIALWFAWLLQDSIITKFDASWTSEERGQWGDSFGALNALFAALAFVSVVVTLIWQQKQIRLTQEDQHRQRFESSYFELLRLLDNARDSVEFRYSYEYYSHKKESLKTNTAKLAFNRNHSGVDCFKAAWHEAYFHIRDEGRYPPKEVVAATYVIHIHNAHETTFSPYFRLLYTILNRIKRDPLLLPEEKINYGNLLRSRLTSYELAIAALNGLSEVSNDFDKLIVEFRLLKYVPQGLRRSFLSQYYPDEAFRGRD